MVKAESQVTSSSNDWLLGNVGEIRYNQSSDIWQIVISKVFALRKKMETVREWKNISLQPKFVVFLMLEEANSCEVTAQHYITKIAIAIQVEYSFSFTCSKN